MIALLTSLAASPVVTKWLPVLARELAKYFQDRAAQLEVRAAAGVAKSAKSAEELRLASIRLGNAVRNR